MNFSSTASQLEKREEAAVVPTRKLMTLSIVGSNIKCLFIYLNSLRIVFASDQINEPSFYIVVTSSVWRLWVSRGGSWTSLARIGSVVSTGKLLTLASTIRLPRRGREFCGALGLHRAKPSF